MRNFTRSDEGIDQKEYNELPYTQALRLDHRNFIKILITIILLKIEIIQIIFFPEEYTHRSLITNIFLLKLLLSFFINSILYNDDIVSQKYHNNGELDTFTTIFLSLVSSLVSTFIAWIVKRITSFHHLFIVIVNEKKTQKKYLKSLNYAFKLMNNEFIIFIFVNLFLQLMAISYLTIFCIVYKNSQISLIKNFFTSFAEDLIISVGFSVLVTIFRKLGLTLKIKQLYETSRFIDSKT